MPPKPPLTYVTTLVTYVNVRCNQGQLPIIPLYVLWSHFCKKTKKMWLLKDPCERYIANILINDQLTVSLYLHIKPASSIIVLSFSNQHLSQKPKSVWMIDWDEKCRLVMDMINLWVKICWSCNAAVIKSSSSPADHQDAFCGVTCSLRCWISLFLAE